MKDCRHPEWLVKWKQRFTAEPNTVRAVPYERDLKDKSRLPQKFRIGIN